MSKVVTIAAAVLIAATAGAFAQGVSKDTPGHQMQQDKAKGIDVDKGASTYSPGHQMQDAKEKGLDVNKGASSFAPGQRNETTGSGSTSPTTGSSGMGGSSK